MDRYLVNPLARWIVHSTGWNLSTATTWARVFVVLVIVALALWVYGAIGGEII